VRTRPNGVDESRSRPVDPVEISSNIKAHFISAAVRDLASTKYLTGQSVGLQQPMESGKPALMFFGEFDCYRSRTEAVLVGMARGAVSLAGKVIGSLRSR
jgi:hypothetical protein